MRNVFIIIRFLLFLLSNLGYWEFIRSKTKIHKYFLPSVTVVFQITVMFISGLLNTLSVSSFLLLFIGLLLLAYFLLNKKAGFLHEYFSLGFFFLIIGLIVCSAVLRRQIFVDYDNFSHWAMVVRVMLEKNRFPNFKDSLIMFKEYPLGSSAFIYYFSHCISASSESVWMAGQVYMMLTMIMPLFLYVVSNKIMSTILIVFFTNFIFCYNIRINSLLVDTLLPLVGFCAAVFVYENFRSRETDTFDKLSLGFFLLTLQQIKNSGVFFIAIIFIQMLVYACRNRKCFSSHLICFLFPFVSWFLWKQHCKYVFSNAERTKHAMTLVNYKTNFTAKTIEEIKLIAHKMADFELAGIDLYFFLAFLIMIGVAAYLVNKEFAGSYGKLFIINILIYVIYAVGMFGMYIFSMPGGEATDLASADRYRRSIFILLYMTDMFVFLKLISGTMVSTKQVLSSVIVFIVMLLSWREVEKSDTVFIRDDSYERRWIENIAKSYDVPPKSSYAILIPKGDADYSFFLTEYIFQSTEVSALVIDSIEQLDLLANYSYIFIYDKGNETIQSWVRMFYPEQFGNDVIVTN